MAFETGIQFKIDPTGATSGAGIIRRGMDSVVGAARTVERRLLSIGRSVVNFFRGIARQIFSLQGLIGGALAGFSVAGLAREIGGFQAEMARVRAVTGAGARDMEAMTKVARELGATTAFSAAEAASGMAFLGQAGFKTRQILESIPHTLDLAIAGSLDLGRAADIVSNVMTGFRASTAETQRFVDVLAKTAASANTNIEQMGEGMKFVAPVAAALGVDVELTAAAVGKLSDAGLQASLAGTGLRRILTELESPSAKTRQLLAGVGLTADDVRVSSVGLTRALRTLKNAGVEAGLAFEIFGDRGGPSFEVLVSSLPGMRELELRLRNSTGAAREMAAVMGDQLLGDFKNLKSAFSELIFVAGDGGVANAFRTATQALTDFLRSNRVKAFATEFGHFFERAAKVSGQFLIAFRGVAGDVLRFTFELSKQIINSIIAALATVEATFRRTFEVAKALTELPALEAASLGKPFEGVAALGRDLAESVLTGDFQTPHGDRVARENARLQKEIADRRKMVADGFGGLGEEVAALFTRDFVGELGQKIDAAPLKEILQRALTPELLTLESRIRELDLFNPEKLFKTADLSKGIGPARILDFDRLKADTRAFVGEIRRELSPLEVAFGAIFKMGRAELLEAQIAYDRFIFDAEEKAARAAESHEKFIGVWRDTARMIDRATESLATFIATAPDRARDKAVDLVRRGQAFLTRGDTQRAIDDANRAAQLVDESKTPEMRLRDQIAEVERLREQMDALDRTAADRKIAQITEELDRQSTTAGAGVRTFWRDYSALANNASVQVQDVLHTTTAGFEDAFANIVTGTQSVREAFHSMAQAVLAELARIIARMLIVRLIGGVFGGLFGAGEAAAGAAGGATTAAVPQASGGGIFRGPRSGYPVILHDEEAVIPLSGSQPVVKTPLPIDAMAQGFGQGREMRVVENYYLTNEVHIDAIDTQDLSTRIGDVLPNHQDAIGIMAAQARSQKRGLREFYER